MTMYLLLSIILFPLITWKRFDIGVLLLFALLPTYLIRFSIGPIPTTLLEILLLLTVTIGLYTYRQQIIPTCRDVWHTHRWICIGIILFLFGATIGVATSVDVRTALGEWKAFYIEPLLLGITLLIATREHTRTTHSVLAGVALSASAVILFTLWQVAMGGTFVPPGFWQPDGTFRATAWYGFPNGVGILLGLSLFPALLWWTKQRTQPTNLQSSIFRILYPVSYILYIFATIVAIFFAKSTGAIIGILGGISILLVTYKKTRIPTLVTGILALAVFILLPLSHPVKQELLLQDRSGQIRTHMWAETWELLKDTPLHGASMASYHERIIPYHTTVHGEGIEIFHHPHNIFLTMWVNTGLIGLIGFVLILINATALLIRTKQWYLFAFLGAFIVMGLVDSPYIKNDWAVLFWAMIALSIPYTSKNTRSLLPRT